METALLEQLGQLFAALQNGQLADAEREEAAGCIMEISDQIIGDDSLGEGQYSLAALLRCAAARLRQEDTPPIPAAYAAQWAEWI